MNMGTLVQAIGLGTGLLTAGVVHAATDPAAICKEVKARAAGTKASGLLTAFANNVKAPHPARLAADISKAQSRMTAAFNSAESAGGCATTGDVGVIEAKTDAFVAQAIEDIVGPICGNGIKGWSEECDGGPPDGAGPSADCLSGVCEADCECEGPCGNGEIDLGEACDEGGANGTAAACCTATCTLKAASELCTDNDANACTIAACDGVGSGCDQDYDLALDGAPCGNPAGTACTNPDTCDGAGGCQPNHAASSTPCADIDGNACTVAGCNGAGGCDQGHLDVANGTPCGSPADTACTNPDTCDGAGVCRANHEPNGFGCGNPADTECTDSDTCDGAGNCQANHAGNGAPCGDQGVVCQNNDTCDGAGSCTNNGPSAPGTPCGSPVNTECTDPDTCNGTGACLANHAAAGAPCGDQGQPCRHNDACDGAGGCADNGAVAASTPCPDTDGEPCTTAGCNGAGACNQGHVMAPDGTTCGPSSGCSSETCQAGVCTDQSACCNINQGLLSFETTLASGNCGVLRNFRCSNDLNKACAIDADCGASNTCNEQVGGGMPFDLKCGGAYTGGGLNAVPLPWVIPDRVKTVFTVTGCDDVTGALTLGPTTPHEVGQRQCTQGRRCAGSDVPCVVDADCGGSCESRCFLGPPLPVPNSMTPPTSFCAVNVVVEDGSGSAQCGGGATDLSLPMATLAYLTGDLFTTPAPPNIPGVQPCPICDRLCVGGPAQDFPCDGDSDCPGGFCTSEPRCLGGPNDGMACEPETSGAGVLGDGFPTSHDCPPEPSTVMTTIDARRPFAFDLSSGTIQKNAPDLGSGPGGSRVFCGFCRDSFGEGTTCFEGDTDSSCPVGAVNSVPCESDADCSAPYESCVQRTSGAFSREATTQINMFGSSDGQCLGDGLPHEATLASVFCIGPHFNSVVDGAADLPGPGGASVPVMMRLSASAAFVDVGNSLVD
jgi:hypothetical protein